MDLGGLHVLMFDFFLWCLLFIVFFSWKLQQHTYHLAAPDCDAVMRKTKQLVFITQKKCDLNDTSIIAADEFAPRLNGNTVNTRCEYDVVVNVSHITPMKNLDINK